MKFFKSSGITIFTLVWILMVGSGMKILADYQNAPGQNPNAQTAWPSQSRFSYSRSTPTLVMLAHPQCPCTRASLSELARIMAQCNGKLAVHVVFLKPDAMSEDWLKSDLWKSAAAIPGVQVERDENGALARIFGAKTSGQVFLYNTSGALVFSGGITESRAHEGDNDGSDAIVSFVSSGKIAHRSTPVFGCAVFAPSASAPSASAPSASAPSASAPSASAPSASAPSASAPSASAPSASAPSAKADVRH